MREVRTNGVTVSFLVIYFKFIVPVFPSIVMT